MNISERDILAVLHVTSRKALDARAKTLLERAGNRYWKWWQRWSMLYLCMAIGSVFLYFIYIIYQIMAEKAVLETKHSVWVLPVFFIFFANWIVRRVILDRASFKVIRRWHGNPFLAIPFLIREWPSSDQQCTVIEALKARLDLPKFGNGQFQLILKFIALDPKMLCFTLLGAMMFYSPMSVLFISEEFLEKPFVSLFIVFPPFIGLLMLIAIYTMALRQYRDTVRNVLPDIQHRQQCPRCRYDLRGTNLIIENGEKYIRCPECDYKGMVG